MPPTDPTAPPSEPTPKPSRAKPGLIAQEHKDAIELATALHREAAKLDNAPILAGRDWGAAQQTALAASIDRCNEIVASIRKAKSGRATRTQEEQTARDQLIAALDPILTGVRRTYPDGHPERAAYGIGPGLGNTSTFDLLSYAKYAFAQLISETGYQPPKAVLKGVKIMDIVTLGALHDRYRGADWAQRDAGLDSEQLTATLRAEVRDVLNPARRDLQGAADQAWTHRDPLNAPLRKAFALQPDRPFVD